MYPANYDYGYQQPSTQQYDYGYQQPAQSYDYGYQQPAQNYDYGQQPYDANYYAQYYEQQAPVQAESNETYAQPPDIKYYEDVNAEKMAGPTLHSEEAEAINAAEFPEDSESLFLF